MADQTCDQTPRFGFGMNWQAFLSTVNEERIRQAENSLSDMLNVKSLKGLSFLDIGCGSGLFSLAALRLEASSVHSFDYDPDCVECARALKKRYFPDSSAWTVERGDVLDVHYLSALGRFDVVYSWGVLHHTGNMWKALDLVSMSVAPGGILYIAIYDDAGLLSRTWLLIKKIYNNIPSWLRLLYIMIFLPMIEAPQIIKNLMAKRSPFYHWGNYHMKRGMSRWHDIKDMVGGYPYEFAPADKIFNLYRSKDFYLQGLRCGRNGGNNQFVFKLNSYQEARSD